MLVFFKKRGCGGAMNVVMFLHKKLCSGGSFHQRLTEWIFKKIQIFIKKCGSTWWMLTCFVTIKFCSQNWCSRNLKKFMLAAFSCLRQICLRKKIIKYPRSAPDSSLPDQPSDCPFLTIIKCFGTRASLLTGTCKIKFKRRKSNISRLK